MKKLYLPLFILSILSSAIAVAQNESDSGYHSLAVKVKPLNDSTAYVSVLKENAPQLVNVKTVPRFAILGKEDKFYMGIGANIKAVALYDIGNPIANPNDFITSQIPMSIPPGNGAEFRFSAQQSNVYMNIVALPGQKDQLGAFVSFNFTGNDYTPSLAHAYLKYRDITAGYTYSLFTDIAASPASIDYEGPNAFTAVCHGMIGFEPFLDKEKNWKAGIGLDIPEYSFTNADKTSTVTQRVPDIPFYIQRYWADNKGWLRLSGIVRNLYYRDLVSDRNIDKVGWGIKASGTTPIAGGLSAYYQAVYGKGIASYIQDLSGLGMDLMPDPSDPGSLDTVETWAGFASLQYNFTPDLFCTATYSHVRTYANSYHDSTSGWNSQYKYAQYVLANVFYNVNSILQIGAEYIYGRRVDYNNSQAHDNRFQAMLQVSF